MAYGCAGRQVKVEEGFVNQLLPVTEEALPEKFRSVARAIRWWTEVNVIGAIVTELSNGTPTRLLVVGVHNDTKRQTSRIMLATFNKAGNHEQTIYLPNGAGNALIEALQAGNLACMVSG